jgi:hypothetical protein
VVCRSFAHPKQIPFKVRMGMADIHCSDDHGSYSLFHPSNEEMTYVQMDTISGLNNCKILGITDHLSSIEVSSTKYKTDTEDKIDDVT